MSVKEHDPLTGHLTTGHEWNGITELNTRVPRAIWWFIGITHVYALIVWILVPSWPLVTTYTKGLLGTDQRERVEARIAEAKAARAGWAERIAALPVEEIRADAELRARVTATAPALFGDNCAVCHGSEAAGGPGFPSLVDDAWLWGGGAETVMETLRVGINSRHPETRVSQMLAFGRDGILTHEEIRTVTDYVQSLSGIGAPPQERLAAGAEMFADNCAGCHGADGAGDTALGAPDLTDGFWIYGGDDEAIFATIRNGRQGWMPAWEDRLGIAERKILTAYLQELAERDAP